MDFETFNTYADSLRRGCMNRLADMENDSSVEEYNWYAETHNDLSGTLMSLNVQYHNDE